MTWSKMFIKCKIERKKELFVATMTYSYYGLYHYNEMRVYETLEEAEKALLWERCGGLLSYVSEEEKKL